ncbi:class I SAM-dependent methyltransferase, partial [Akkermansiaceae bacterium]|nr:class I SAM-dependent methyltransferase [Akkermansiaceae bacterium]
SEIARESVRSQSNVNVVNRLFDDALDIEIAALGQTVDVAYIDGHHEKVATIHYFNRLLKSLTKGSVVLFDDISWSQDMRDGWDLLSKRIEFAHAIDLGAIGVCVMKTNEQADAIPRYWDLQPLVGRHPIAKPHGWDK